MVCTPNGSEFKRINNAVPNSPIPQSHTFSVHNHTGGALIKRLRRYVVYIYIYILPIPASSSQAPKPNVRCSRSGATWLWKRPINTQHSLQHIFVLLWFFFSSFFLASDLFALVLISVCATMCATFRQVWKPTDFKFDRVRLSARVFTLQRCSQSVIWCELINWLKSKNHSLAHNSLP